MKRLVFYSILILVFLATCKPFEPEEANNNTPDADPPAAYQGTASVTIYLDGNGRAASRAMNRTFSEMGCDYFEVVFKYNNNGTYETAIGQWRIGERAGVSGVSRSKSGGVDYTGVSFEPAAGTGSAILLAGKSDRTLMGIGKLSLVDGQSASSNLINLNTISVTFDVAAIKAGVNADPVFSSFKTAAGNNPDYLTVTAANTLTTAEEIMGIYFLTFKLASSISKTKAVYTFQLHSGTANLYTNFGAYVTTGGGLRVASAGTAEKKYPSYTTSEGGNINVNSIILLDERTSVTMDNNQTADIEFNPAVEFSFNTNNSPATKAGSIFALVFEIPVYALDKRCSWFIRPGYGVLKYELDDGLGGMGGAVLIKTGELRIIVPVTDFKIEIKHAPDKWRYRWTGSNGYRTAETSERTDGESQPHDVWEYNRVFRTNGLKVQLQNADDGSPYNSRNSYQDSSIFDVSGGNTVANSIIKTDNLTYIVGKKRINNGDTLAPEFYGLIEVTVRFTDQDSGVSAEDKFFILVSGCYATSGANIHNSTNRYDYANIQDIRGCVNDNNTSYQTYIAPIPATQNEARNDFMNAVQNASGNNSLRTNRIAIIRLTGSFDIADAALNLNANVGNGISDATLIMIVATNTNGTVILGRQSGYNGGTRINIRGARSGLTAFYFGKWPFAGLIHSPDTLKDTKRFIVNAGGTVVSAAGGPDAAPLYNNKMLTDGATAERVPGGGGIYNVDIDPKRYDVTPGASTYPHQFETGVDIYRRNLLH